jgi:fatty acid desaturase
MTGIKVEEKQRRNKAKGENILIFFSLIHLVYLVLLFLLYFVPYLIYLFFFFFLLRCFSPFRISGLIVESLPEGC